MHYKIRPTLRQTIAIKKLAEIIGNPQKHKQKKITIGRILKEAGYSSEIAKSPEKVTGSRGWQLLMDEYFPENEVAKVHKDLLHAARLDHYVFPASEKDKVIREIVEKIPGCVLVRIRKCLQWKRAYYWTPDNKTRDSAIDKAYKLRGKYKKESSGMAIGVFINQDRKKYGFEEAEEVDV